MVDGHLTIPEAIARALDGSSRRAVARSLDIPPSTITRWTQGVYSPKIEDIPALEDALGLRRGTIFTAAGYVEPATDVPSALAMDLELDEPARLVVANAYEAALAHCRARREIEEAADDVDEGA